MPPTHHPPLRHRRRLPRRYASSQLLMSRMAVVMSLLFALSMVISHLSRPVEQPPAMDAKIESTVPAR